MCIFIIKSVMGQRKERKSVRLFFQFKFYAFHFFSYTRKRNILYAISTRLKPTEWCRKVNSLIQIWSSKNKTKYFMLSLENITTKLDRFLKPQAIFFIWHCGQKTVPSVALNPTRPPTFQKPHFLSRFLWMREEPDILSIHLPWEQLCVLNLYLYTIQFMLNFLLSTCRTFSFLFPLQSYLNTSYTESSVLIELTMPLWKWGQTFQFHWLNIYKLLFKKLLAFVLAFVTISLPYIQLSLLFILLIKEHRE